MVEKKKDEPKAAPEKTQEELEAEFQNEQARLHELAQAVLRGDLGRGLERKEALGPDLEAVLKIVRQIRSGNQNGTEDS